MGLLFLSLEYAQLFAALIARTAKDVDVLIDSLPSEESTAALQVWRLNLLLWLNGSGKPPTSAIPMLKIIIVCSFKWKR